MKLVSWRVLTRLIPVSTFIFFLLHANANATPSTILIKPNLPLTLEVGLGYSYYRNMLGDDGLTAVTRLGITKELIAFNRFHTAIELDVQSGNSGKLCLPQSFINAMGGLSVYATIKPMPDLLLSEKIFLLQSQRMFALIKAGIMYRQIVFDRTTINGVTELDPEVQLGIGYQINHSISLALICQEIISGKPRVSMPSPEATSIFKNIPAENSFMLALSINLEGVEPR